MQNTEKVHIVPIDDIRDHQDSIECWCEPFEVEDGVIVHNSLDGREKYENGAKPQ